MVCNCVLLILLLHLESVCNKLCIMGLNNGLSAPIKMNGFPRKYVNWKLLLLLLLYFYFFFPLLLWFSYLEMTLNIAIVYFQSYQKYLQTHTWNHPLSLHASCSENTILDPQTCLQTETLIKHMFNNIKRKSQKVLQLNSSSNLHVRPHSVTAAGGLLT